MGEVRVNLTNFIVVGLMAFAFTWAANKGLKKLAGANVPMDGS